MCPSRPAQDSGAVLLEFRLIGSDVPTVELYEPVAFHIPLYFVERQLTECAFQNLRCQYPVACYGVLGEIGFDRELARINRQLELRSSFCSFRCNRVPALGSHLLTPILNLSLAVEKLGCLAITLMAC